MEFDHIELKRQARERMALTDPKFWVVALAYIAMTAGVSLLFSLIPLPGAEDGSLPATHLFLQLLLNLYTTVVRFGLCLWALWTYRQLDPDANSLMQGFSVAGRVVLMNLGIYVRVLGWYLLVGFTLSIPVLVLLLSGAGAGIGMFTLLLFFAGLIATIVILRLRYALAPYLLADRPDDGASAPIHRSAALMRGWKRALFRLELSFLGWHLINLFLSLIVTLFFLDRAGLSFPQIILDPAQYQQAIVVINSLPVFFLTTVVTIPVTLWLLPYQETARAGFYDFRLLAASDATDRPDMPPL